LRAKKRFISNLYNTCPDEIMVILGCVPVMGYNKLPAMQHHWRAS